MPRSLGTTDLIRRRPPEGLAQLSTSHPSRYSPSAPVGLSGSTLSMADPAAASRRSGAVDVGLRRARATSRVAIIRRLGTCPMWRATPCGSPSSACGARPRPARRPCARRGRLRSACDDWLAARSSGGRRRGPSDAAAGFAVVATIVEPAGRSELGDVVECDIDAVVGAGDLRRGYPACR